MTRSPFLQISACFCLLVIFLLAALAKYQAFNECARLGDTTSQVARFCGEPSTVDSWEERRVAPLVYDIWLIRDRDYYLRETAVTIEE